MSLNLQLWLSAQGCHKWRRSGRREWRSGCKTCIWRMIRCWSQGPECSSLVRRSTACPQECTCVRFKRRKSCRNVLMFYILVLIKMKVILTLFKVRVCTKMQFTLLCWTHPFKCFESEILSIISAFTDRYITSCQLKSFDRQPNWPFLSAIPVSYRKH